MSIEKHISAYVDIDLDASDVIDFIKHDADKKDLESIATALGGKNIAVEIPEPEKFMRDLIDEANRFGIKSMISVLRYEARKYGINLYEKLED